MGLFVKKKKLKFILLYEIIAFLSFRGSIGQGLNVNIEENICQPIKFLEKKKGFYSEH